MSRKATTTTRISLGSPSQLGSLGSGKGCLVSTGWWFHSVLSWFLATNMGWFPVTLVVHGSNHQSALLHGGWPRMCDNRSSNNFVWCPVGFCEIGSIYPNNGWLLSALSSIGSTTSAECPAMIGCWCHQVWGLFMDEHVFPGADASCPMGWVGQPSPRP